MAVFKTKRRMIDGESVYEQVKVKPSEIKKTIMDANNWNEDQYRKQYDIFKNKLRAYESYRKAHGAEVEKQSPLEVLYKQAKAKAREGSAYKPSLEMQRIQSFSAVSITKGRKLAQDFESGYSKARAKSFAATTEKAFSGLIENTPQAQDIMSRITDPVKREEALKALAEYIHAKQAPSGALFSSGETYGSDEAANGFDITEWLDEDELEG